MNDLYIASFFCQEEGFYIEYFHIGNIVKAKQYFSLNFV